MQKIDITGQRFGKLEVLEYSHSDKYYASYWKCRCDCGRIVTVRGASMTSGITQSCGCYQIEKAKERASKVLLKENRTNICIDCQKACGGCSWSEIDPATKKIRFEPVPGWTAKKVRLNSGIMGGKRRILETYHITACPEFVRDERRNHSFGECSLERLYEIYDEWVRRGEFE